MKPRTVLGLLLAAVAVLGLSPAPGWAQHTGFRVAVAPPQFGTPVPHVQVGPRSTFGATPFAYPFPYPVQYPLQQGIVPVPLVPNFPAVVPNQFFLPGQPGFPGQILNPGLPVVVPGQQFFPPQLVHPAPAVFVPPTVIQPALPVAPQPILAPPLVGTSRAEVLRRFGQPSVTIVTSTGETFYFTGGVTVIIQNGQVAGPR